LIFEWNRSTEEEFSIVNKKNLKVFLHPPPPPEWERFIKAVGLMIQRLDI
jgi:hypothetical protein